MLLAINMKVDIDLLRDHKGLTVHRVNRLSGMTNLTSWIPGEYLELKRIKRPKSKIRSGLDFRGKNQNKVDSEVEKVVQNSILDQLILTGF